MTFENVYQASWGDITLPDVVTQGNDDSNVWDGEDPLFYGLAMEAGDNPLDVDFDVDPEKMRDEVVEEPEVRRDSDGSVLMAAGRQSELSKALDVSKADLPDMDFDTEEPVLGRESAAHALSLPGSGIPMCAPVYILLDMFICMCVCGCVYIYMYVYVYICFFMCVSLNVHLCMCIYVKVFFSAVCCSVHWTGTLRARDSYKKIPCLLSLTCGVSICVYVCVCVCECVFVYTDTGTLSM